MMLHHMAQSTEISQEVRQLTHRVESVQRALAEVSHEIRNQLAGILGLAQVALQTSSPSEQFEYLGLIHTTGEELLTLVNDVLDISKVEAGQLRMEAIPFGLVDCVRDTVATLAPAAADKLLNLEVLIDEAVPARVVGDPGRLRQVLVNLVSNAIKFTERGEVVVGVEVESGTGSTLVVGFSVSDTGVGLPPGMREAIFDPFVQADRTVAGSHGGTGLGLAICRQLVELMDGRVWVDPGPEGGSVFRFTASLPAAHQQANRRLASRRGVNDVPVLVVAEGPGGGQLLLEALTAEGLPPCSVVDARMLPDVLEDARQAGDPIELVVFDMVADFQQPIRQLRAHPQAEQLHLAVLTSGGERGDGALCRTHQVGCYLTYPLTTDEIRAGIQALLNGPAPDQLQYPITKHWLREHTPAPS